MRYHDSVFEWENDNMDRKAAAYCRVSTEREEQKNSLENQKQYFQACIDRKKNWELTEIYYDEGISGTQTSKRAGFNKMMKDAEEGKFDLILTREVSRFARNTVDTLYYTRKLKSMGIRVVFTSDHIDTWATDGELRLTIMAGIAQEESRKISERVRWGQQRQMEKGVVFGRDLLGYRVEKGKLYINFEEKPIIKKIFYKYVVEEKSISEIVKELTKEGLRPKSKENWTAASVRKILQNEKYVGDLCQKKTITTDYITHEKKYNHGIEKKIYIYDHHEPIIDRKLWNQAQKKLAQSQKDYRLKGTNGFTKANNKLEK